MITGLKIEWCIIYFRNYQMESKVNELNELMRTQVGLKNKYYEICQEKRDTEALLNKKEEDNDDCLRDVELKIRQLQNELGSDIVLNYEDELALRKDLMAIDDIINKIENDDSEVVLIYDIPDISGKLYSTHVNINTGRGWGRDATSFNVVIKTKCPPVERIVREVMQQHDGMMHYRDNNPSPEEQDKIDLTIRREWLTSQHNERSIHFRHKKDFEKDEWPNS